MISLRYPHSGCFAHSSSFHLAPISTLAPRVTPRSRATQRCPRLQRLVHPRALPEASHLFYHQIPSEYHSRNACSTSIILTFLISYQHLSTIWFIPIHWDLSTHIFLRSKTHDPTFSFYICLLLAILGHRLHELRVRPLDHFPFHVEGMPTTSWTRGKTPLGRFLVRSLEASR